MEKASTKISLFLSLVVLVMLIIVIVRLAPTLSSEGSSNDFRPLDIEVEFLNGTTPRQQAYVYEQVRLIVPTIITPEMNALDRQLAIHYWLIDNLEYDHTGKYIDAYSALTVGKTVCGGYATLYSLMLAEAGIESKVVTGKNIHNPDPLGHAWNLVKIDGKWYHADATWADREGRELLYFNRSDADFDRKGYYWDRSKYPKAPSNMTLHLKKS